MTLNVPVGIFECEATFEIKGRGQVLAGWVTGPIDPGYRIQRHVDGEWQQITVTGVERHPVVGADTRVERRKAGLLIRGTVSDPLGPWETLGQKESAKNPV